MNSDELKKKIVEVVLNSEITGIQIRAITGGYSMANNIADTLIAAGLRFGENLTATFDRMALEREHELEHRLAEAEHRAEVAEKALRNRARQYVDLQGYPTCDVAILAAEFVVPDDLKKAEKELTEERKDD